jgi:hypothetical protein
MSNKKFSVAESLKFGFYEVFDNFYLFFWVTVVSGLMYLLLISTFFILSPLTSLGILREVRSFQAGYTQPAPHLEQPSPELNSEPHDIDTASMQAIQGVQTKINTVIEKAKTAFNRVVRLIEWQFFIKLLIVLLIIMALWLGYTKITLEMYDNDTSSVRTLFSGFWKAPAAFIATIIYFAIVALGLAFFIIPGLIAFVRFGYYRHFMVDKDAGIIDSLRRSFNATKGETWNLFSLSLAMILIPLSLLPVLFFIKHGVYLASTAAYRKLAVKN